MRKKRYHFPESSCGGLLARHDGCDEECGKPPSFRRPASATKENSSDESVVIARGGGRRSKF